MARRLAAAAAGAVLISAAVLAFALAKHPVVAGTNTAAPFYPAVPLRGGETRCQLVSRVPAGATHLRVTVDSVTGAEHVLSARVLAAGDRITATGRRQVRPGGLVILLDRPTRALHPATVCLTYSTAGRIVLAGEMKRVPARHPGSADGKRNVASLIFLRSGLSSWVGFRDTIVQRFADAQPGVAGGWSLWVAAALALAAGALAVFWLVLRLEPRG